MIDPEQRERIGQVVESLDSHMPRTWDMVGIGLWIGMGKPYLRAELHLHRESAKRLLYVATGGCRGVQGSGLDILLTRGVDDPEDYTGSFGCVGTRATVGERVWSVAYTVDLGADDTPARPWSLSLGPGETAPKWWLCDYRLAGEW
jgi:hypothetical protein